MNIEVEFKEETPSFEVPATAALAVPTVGATGSLRRRFWLAWQLFGREDRPERFS